MAELVMMVPALLVLLLVGLYIHSSRLLRASWKRERELVQLLTEATARLTVSTTNTQEALALVTRWENIANDYRDLAQGKP